MKPSGRIRRYAIWGQSNASGKYVNLYQPAPVGHKLFGNDYVLHDLSDPVDSPVNQVDTVSLDANPGGSHWGLLADIIYQRTGDLVEFVPCALSGAGFDLWARPGAPGTTSNDPLDRATLYGSGLYRARLRNVDAILFQGGETSQYQCYTLEIAIQKLWFMLNPPPTRNDGVSRCTSCGSSRARASRPRARYRRWPQWTTRSPRVG